jgi:hypothetical protein
MRLFLPFVFCVLSCYQLLAQVPVPADQYQGEGPVSLEQNVLRILSDSLLVPRLFTEACGDMKYHQDYNFLVYDSSAHIPEPMMVYHFAHPELNKKEIEAIAERQILEYASKRKWEFDRFTSQKVHFTDKAKDFRDGYYLVRFSNPMQYQDRVYIDVWIKDQPTHGGINVLFKCTLGGTVTGWQIYRDCRAKG